MTRIFLAALLGVVISKAAYSQQSDPFAPAQPLAGGWEKMDERLIFLMVRLVDVEANLEAVDLAIAKSSARAGVARSAASRAEAGSDRMDRRAGGPVRWDQFYGRTAEKFFYHPTDNHTYHTETILSQQAPSNDNQSESGVPSRQGVPVHQRPPQFDYMYRANENAKERATAEVAKIANKVDALAARRAELELEQSKLWCDIAFRVVSRNDLDKKPVYRFMPKGSGQESLTAAASFVVVALSIVKSGESDQGGAFRQIKPMVSKARSELGDKWLQLGVKYQDQASDEWKFAMLARHLEDVSSNLSDSYAVSVESARNSDNDRRDMYRGLLQKSLVQYAEAVLALNEMASEMATARDYEPDLQKPLLLTSVVNTGRAYSTVNETLGAEPTIKMRNGSMADLLEPGDNVVPSYNSPSGEAPQLQNAPPSNSSQFQQGKQNSTEATNLLLAKMRSGNGRGPGWRIDKKGLHFEFVPAVREVVFPVPAQETYSLLVDFVKGQDVPATSRFADFIIKVPLGNGKRLPIGIRSYPNGSSEIGAFGKNKLYCIVGGGNPGGGKQLNGPLQRGSRHVLQIDVVQGKVNIADNGMQVLAIADYHGVILDDGNEVLLQASNFMETMVLQCAFDDSK